MKISPLYLKGSVNIVACGEATKRRREPDTHRGRRDACMVSSAHIASVEYTLQRHKLLYQDITLLNTKANY